MEEMPSLNMPFQRLKVGILPLELPCSGPVTHSGEILTTGKSHGKKPGRFSLNNNMDVEKVWRFKYATWNIRGLGRKEEEELDKILNENNIKISVITESKKKLQATVLDLWRDFCMRETGSGQQVVHLHDRYMMMIIIIIIIISYLSLFSLIKAFSYTESDAEILAKHVHVSSSQQLHVQ